VTERVRALELLPLLAGVAALVAGTLLGWDARILDLIVSPPLVVRLALAGASVVLAFVLLGAAVARLEGRDGVRGNLPSMVRGIRLAFLAVAALAVAAGWLLAHPLPFVVALIIAGIDVVETSFLLLVVRRSPSA
jgi:hypothetical protein